MMKLIHRSQTSTVTKHCLKSARVYFSNDITLTCCILLSRMEMLKKHEAFSSVATVVHTVCPLCAMSTKLPCFDWQQSTCRLGDSYVRRQRSGHHCKNIQARFVSDASCIFEWLGRLGTAQSGLLVRSSANATPLIPNESLIYTDTQWLTAQLQLRAGQTAQ